MVWVPQQLVGASLGATVTIECWLEAHPAALHYWSRPDGQVLHDPSKYRIESINSAAVMSNRSAYTVSSKSNNASIFLSILYDSFILLLEHQSADNEMNQTPMMNPSSYMTHLKLTIRHLSAKDYGP